MCFGPASEGNCFVDAKKEKFCRGPESCTAKGRKAGDPEHEEVHEDGDPPGTEEEDLTQGAHKQAEEDPEEEDLRPPTTVDRR